SIFIVSEFLDSGVVFIQEEVDGKKYEYSVTPGGSLTDLPLVVLVNRGTASASEIVAGSLRHYDRAVILGETTFGKGTIQEPLELAQGAGLHVTVAHWLLPDGGSVDKVGIEPDVIVENLNLEIDEELEQGLEILTAGEEG
ncbi:S41 family peptidase, partial [Patescibacteria group bacterium]|nr:S41 family peptidase [Patescibacteria group bacterium]